MEGAGERKEVGRRRRNEQREPRSVEEEETLGLVRRERRESGNQRRVVQAREAGREEGGELTGAWLAGSGGGS